MASIDNTLPAAPLIDPRTESVMADQTATLATIYTGGAWSAPVSEARPLDLGSTLIQIFSRMLSHVSTRLNQVPEKNHLAFLDLLGAQRQPPVPARAPLTFQLVEGSSGAVMPSGTPVAAPADENFAEAVFTTDSELVLTAVKLAHVFAHDPARDTYSNPSASSGVFVAFDAVSTPGGDPDLDADLVRIDQPVPNGPDAALRQVPALYLGFDGQFAPRPISLYVQIDPPTPSEVAPRELPRSDPLLPPRLAWEYLRGTPLQWAPLAVDDGTVTFSRSGSVRFLGPTDSTSSTIFGQLGFWIRARLIDGPPALQLRLRRISTNTVRATQASTTRNEILGGSNGNPDQKFRLSQTPVLLGQRVEVNEARAPSGAELAALSELEGPDAVSITPAAGNAPQQVWVRWHEVTDFYASGPGDRHYLFDHLSGTLTFGNGTSGRIPVAGNQNVRAARYQSGGGSIGNRAAGAISQLRTAIPYVASVRNHEGAGGGSDGETLARVKARSSRILRHGWRAVTAQDFEDLAFEASSAVARAVAVTPTFDPNQQSRLPDDVRKLHVLSPGQVLVVVVPWSSAARPNPTPELLNNVREYLSARCAPALTLQVTGPPWAKVTVKARIFVRSSDSIEGVRANALAAIQRFLHPLTGNSEGSGWAFGQQPQPSDLYLLLSRIDGIDHVGPIAVEGGFEPVVSCEPPLEYYDGTSAPPPEQRKAKMTLIFSGDHTIIAELASAAQLRLTSGGASGGGSQ